MVILHGPRHVEKTSVVLNGITGEELVSLEQGTTIITVKGTTVHCVAEKRYRQWV